MKKIVKVTLPAGTAVVVDVSMGKEQMWQHCTLINDVDVKIEPDWSFMHDGMKYKVHHTYETN